MLLIKLFRCIQLSERKNGESRTGRETNDCGDHDADGWLAEDCVRLRVIKPHSGKQLVPLLAVENDIS